ncbi:MAG TPA: 3-hydroxyacyl-CoA dehydrogenase NAD-binding domain-containing protein [Vicinamibacterales bacterium]|nr:3-hydroxyacyl-CoA dehydrogenase NAD-binding domain-containing protein [Vicinamibacterales bacterium]
MSIRSVGILGAGTMGAQIALHFANAGVPALLLDLTRDAARDGLARARRLKPDPQFTPDTGRLVRTGSFDQDLPALAEVDWVMEAVVERLDVKRDLLARVVAHCAPHAVLSTNTSGIPVGAISEGWPADLLRRWLGTHFFNPPRYLHLLELIPTPETDPAIVAAIAAFGDRVLGKGVVVAKDTPNFIGNHLALHGVAAMLRAVESGRVTIDEVDAITGSAIGRPGSATFRTADIAGLDVLAHVMRNLEERLPRADDRAWFAPSPLLLRLVAAGALGEKSGKGFYERRKDAAGGSAVYTLNPATFEYDKQRKPVFASIEGAAPIEDVGRRVRTLFLAQDRVGEFLRETLAPTLLYAARVAPEIAHSLDDVDRVMRWGFGWERGPFELLDAIGLQEVVAAAAAQGRHDVPPIVADALAAGRNRLREGGLPPAGPGLLVLAEAVSRSQIVKRNAGASLVDLGDGVLCVEFHSKLNSIGGDTLAMLQAGVIEAEANFRALVVGNEAPNFSAGANLMLVLLEAQEGNWDELDLMVRAFQQGVMALRYSQVPVVVAPSGLALGGGCEIALHADRVHAAGDTFMGLVEVGVGLIPAGGGTKEMIARAMARVPSPAADPLPFVQQAFETVALAKVSASGPDAARLGYLSGLDSYSMNRERLIADAKAKALQRVSDGYRAPQPRTAIPVGGESLGAALKLGVHLAWRAGRATDHDLTIGRALAHVFAGGAVPHATTVSEQHLLDLEREAFLRLLGEPKTLARIQHTLKTGKPLRN